MTLAAILVSVATIMLVAAGIIVVVGYFTNWFRAPIGTPPSDTWDTSQLDISVTFSTKTDPSDKWTGVYDKVTDPSSVSINALSNNHDDLVWTVDPSDYVDMWTLTTVQNNAAETRYIAVLQNESGQSPSSPYICAFVNTANHITMYAFGDTANVFDYNGSSAWFRRGDGSLPTVTIEPVTDASGN